MHVPDFKTFKKMTGEGNLIPVYRELLADTQTPVTMLLKLADRPYVFLLESVEGKEKWGRYSLIGTDPRSVVRIRKEVIVVEEGGTIRHFPHRGDPIGFLEALLKNLRPVSVEGNHDLLSGVMSFTERMRKVIV